MHAVLETKSFEVSAKAAGLTEDEKFEIIKTLAADPLKGDIIKGTGGAPEAALCQKRQGQERGLPGGDILRRRRCPGLSARRFCKERQDQLVEGRTE